MKKPCRIVVIGRPNVGKSTLFNRLIGRRRSLVHNDPGVTRDRIEELDVWWVKGRSFPILLVDTGGLGGDHFADEIAKQVDIALEQTECVLFLLDSQVGVTPLDQDLLRKLKQSGIHKKVPLIGVVNKVDTESHEDRVADFYTLGFDSIVTVSAEHGRGMDLLKEEIAQQVGFLDQDINESNEADESSVAGDTVEVEGESEGESEVDLDSDDAHSLGSAPKVRQVPRIAIIGRPNVGKSTLMNAILGENRMITSSIAGTTVDAIDSLVELQDRTFCFVDTAGIRRKGKTEQGVEVLSVVQTRKALDKADVAILVLDGSVGVLDQDEKLSGLIEEAGTAVVLVVNKWDTQRDNKKFTTETAAEQVRSQMRHLKYAPILFVSALRGQGLDHLGDLLEDIIHQRNLKIPTHEFTEWVREESTVHNPKDAKFYLCHQSGRHPPTFVCHVNDPEKIGFSLKRHLINGIRDRWGYMGNPIRIHFVEGKNRRSLPKKLGSKSGSKSG